MKDKIDVLLATYKSNINFLKIQIDSILNQTYSNIQLIISDDNSQDQDLKKLLNYYQNKDSRITVYFQKENLGYNKNFEFLLEKSTNKYISFCDHDDFWHNDKVEKELEKLVKDNLDMVYCDERHIDKNGKILHESYIKYKNVPIINGKSKLAISRCAGLGTSQLITKKVRDKMIPFKTEVIAHDWLAGFIANEENGIGFIEEPLLDYRLHNSNVFGGRNLKQNLKIWKDKNGSNYSSFLKYRNEKVIDNAYLNGAIMCLKYCENESSKRFLNKLIKYYEDLKKSKFINFNFINYFKFLSGKNVGKKGIKEFMIFYFPCFSYIKFKK